MKAKPDQFIIANIKICKNPKKKRLSNVNIVPKSLVIVTAWKIMKILLIKGSKNIFVIPVVITLWTVHIWRDTLKEFMKERKSILANFVIKAFLIAIGWGNMLKPYIWKSLMFGTIRRNENVFKNLYEIIDVNCCWLLFYCLFLLCPKILFAKYLIDIQTLDKNFCNKENNM